MPHVRPQWNSVSTWLFNDDRAMMTS